MMTSMMAFLSIIMLTLSVRLVAGETQIATFTDAFCEKSQQYFTAVDGYPDGVCMAIAEASTTSYGSFMVTSLDPGCVVTIYGNDTSSLTCSATTLGEAEQTRCYNSSWIYLSVDHCTNSSDTSVGSSTSSVDLSTSLLSSSSTSGGPGTSSTNSEASASGNASTKSRSNLGPIVGGIVGSIGGLLLLASIGYRALQYRKRRSTRQPADELASVEGIGPVVIKDNCNNSSTGVDVVFVHGLRGARYKTWTIGEHCWPRDFLPSGLSNARIITWGYDANIANASSFASTESIFGHAHTLLGDLAMNRESITRPIIFVCHSLGGLVVKEALITAARDNSHGRDSSLAAIYVNTRGVLFLGTPHRGTDQVPLGELVAKAAFLRHPNTQLLQSLARDSHLLERQLEDFVAISENLLIRCIREERPMAIGMIVPKASAAYDGFRIKSGSIPADHINMVKFRSPQDIGYVRILKWIREMQDGVNQ